MNTDDQKLFGGLALLTLGVAILVATLGGSCGGPAKAAAQVAAPSDLSRHERRLALELGSVSFNEALDSAPDLELIVQIVLAHSPSGDPQLDAAARLVWLRSHSPCVSGVLTQDQAYARPGNCHWTRNLTPDGRRPRGFHDCHEGEIAPGHTALHPCDGQWSRVRARWRAHLEASVEYVRGTRTADICEETPESWDGKRYGREQLERRGWRVLECADDAVNFAVVRSGS